MSQNKSPKQATQTPEKLSDDIKQFSDFIKSITLTLPKQGRRMLSFASLQRTRNVMSTYLQNQKSYKFSQCQQYAQLLSKQSQTRINDQVYKRLLNLQTKLRSQQFQQKMKQKQKQIEKRAKQKEDSGEKTVNKKQRKQEKIGEIVTVQECVKEFEVIKASFCKIWKEEYFVIMNYRMAITAKELERWTEIADKKITKDQLAQQIDKLFS